GDLHPGERGLLAVLAVPLGVLAVGHLQPAEDHRPVGQPAGDAHLLDGPAAELDVERLAADDVAGAGHDVGRGDAAGDGHADAGVVGEDGVDGPAAALDRPAPLVGVRAARPRPDADVRVGVHQPGDDDGPGEVADLGAGRHLDCAVRSDRLDLAVADD